MTPTDILQRLGATPAAAGPDAIVSRSPIDGSELGRAPASTPADVAASVGRAVEAFEAWRTVQAPRRGELVRLFGEELYAGSLRT